MTTVSEFLTNLQDSGEIKGSGNTSVPTALRRSLLKALSRLSSARATFTEAKFSFTTIANQAEYGSSHLNFPKDAALFDRIEINNGQGVYLRLAATDLDTVRDVLQAQGVLVDPLQPYLYTFAAGELVLGPAPTAAVTLRGWYHRDARRDQSSGNLITSAAGTDSYSNVWFDDGHDALWNLTLKIFHLAFAIDPERAAYYSSEFQDAIRELRVQWLRKRGAQFTTTAQL